MPKQTKIEEFIPTRIKDSTRGFIEMFYSEGAEEQGLPDCRNRHEGYGLLAESYVSLCGAMDSVKAGMKDCLKVLSGEDQAFMNAADATYSSLVDLATSTVQMGVQSLNIIHQMMDRIQRTPLPLEEYAAGLEHGLESEDDSEAVPDLEGEDE